MTTRFQFRWLCPHLHFSTDWYAGKLAFCEIEKPQYLCKKQEPCLWSVRKFLWLFLLILSLWKLYELFPHCASQVPKKNHRNISAHCLISALPLRLLIAICIWCSGYLIYLWSNLYCLLYELWANTVFLFQENMCTRGHLKIVFSHTQFPFIMAFCSMNWCVMFLLSFIIECSLILLLLLIFKVVFNCNVSSFHFLSL